MAYTVRSAEHYHATLADEPQAAYELLDQLAELGIDLVAFTAVPVGPSRVQLTLFPEDPPQLETEARRAGLELDGPYGAILVQGDDELGALAGIHRRLADAGVDVYASTGVTDGRGAFGYLIYVREEALDQGLEALGASG